MYFNVSVYFEDAPLITEPQTFKPLLLKTPMQKLLHKLEKTNIGD
jgi:hypothetical protein